MATITEYLDAFRSGVVGASDDNADAFEGSMYEVIGGAAAIVWSRQSQRDADLFADTLTSTASSDALTSRLKLLYDYDRPVDAGGTGQVTLTRSNISSGGSTFWKGTRIALVSRLGVVAQGEYSIVNDTVVSPTAIRATIDIQSNTPGNLAVQASYADDVHPAFIDAIGDTNWSIQSMTCGAGTLFEKAPQARASARQLQRDRRYGQVKAIVDACQKVGASNVVIFPSNYGATDYGLNMVYVGDGSLRSTQSLINQCALALDDVRVLGDTIQVAGMQPVALNVEVQVYLYDSPSKINRQALEQRLRSYMVQAIKYDYTYSRDALQGALFQASTLVQSVTFTAPVSDAPVLSTVNGALNFPNVLTRYHLDPANISIYLRGPNG